MVRVSPGSALAPFLSREHGAKKDWFEIGSNLKYIGFRIAVPTNIFSAPPALPYLVNPVGRPPKNIIIRTLNRHLTFISRKWWESAGRYKFMRAANKALTGIALGGVSAYLVGGAMTGSLELPEKLQY